MRVLVCGGRKFGDLDLPGGRNNPLWDEREAQYRFIVRTLDKFANEHSEHYNPNDNWLPGDIVIIQGGAKGADSCADQWAATNWCHNLEFKADWENHGKSAGYVRNTTMLKEGKPDVVIAFPGGKGTANMVKLARKANVKVIEVSYARD